MSSGYRRCCCGGGGVPGGGYCDVTSIAYRTRTTGTTIVQVPIDPPDYIPQRFTLTLPWELDLTHWVAEVYGPPFTTPFTPGGYANLCLDNVQTWVLEPDCEGTIVEYATAFTTSAGECLAGVRVRQRYRIWGHTCPQPEMEFEYWWRLENPSPCPALLKDYAGVALPGTIGATVTLWLPSLDVSGEKHTIQYASSILIASQAFPTRTWDGTNDEDYYQDIDNLLAAERQFLEGALSNVPQLFNGTWYHNQCSNRCYLNLPVSIDQIYWPQYCGDAGYCDGDETNEGYTGIVAQAGDSGLIDNETTDTAIYVATSRQDLCVGEGLCKSACVVDGGDLGQVSTEIFPEAITVGPPATMNVAFRDLAPCGNYETTAPSPWTLQTPETMGLVWQPDPTLNPPYCGGDVTAGVLGLPWASVVNLNSTQWKNLGFGVFLGYRPRGTDCGGSPHLISYVRLICGFVLIDPLTVTQLDRRYRLFTMAEVTVNVDRIDVIGFLSESFYAINLGPEFQYGDVSSGLTPLPGDPITEFTKAVNVWDWKQSFVFDTFYMAYLPSTSDSCDGYSYPPAAYAASQARTVSGVADLANYCGDAATPPYSFPVCARGSNHSYRFAVAPSYTDGTVIRPEELVFRYCSFGSPCAPIGPCS